MKKLLKRIIHAFFWHPPNKVVSVNESGQKAEQGQKWTFLCLSCGKRWHSISETTSRYGYGLRTPWDWIFLISIWIGTNIAASTQLETREALIFSTVVTGIFALNRFLGDE